MAVMLQCSYHLSFHLTSTKFAVDLDSSGWLLTHIGLVQLYSSGRHGPDGWSQVTPADSSIPSKGVGKFWNGIHSLPQNGSTINRMAVHQGGLSEAWMLDLPPLTMDGSG